MAFQGPLSPATVVDDSTVGTVIWQGIANVAASDDSRAIALMQSGTFSHFLKATNFGFTVPSDATILGVTVEIERSCSVLTTITDFVLKLVASGTISGTDHADVATFWPTTDAYAAYGSVSDLWGVSLTPAIINASTFGVAIAAFSGSNANALIDHMRITVTYSLPPHDFAVIFQHE